MKNTNLLAGLIILLYISCSSDKEVALQSFKLEDVKITSGPFLQAQQADMAYILAMDPDRLLAPFLKDAGFEPLAPNYPNWENTGLDGHIGGHYLSALAFMYASTGNEELLQRINYMIDWLKKCQDKNGNGYVGGVPNGKKIWAEIEAGDIDAGGFSLNGGWVPLYNIHKLYKGLIDVYQNTHNETSLEILVGLSDWMVDILANLSEEQIQDMLRSEHGGLNEVFVDVAALTGDEKYLETANSLSHRVILDPLLKGQNELTGMHANTQIPKVTGYKRYADATDNQEWNAASEFFWHTIVDKWTVSIGGNSVREHFHPVDDFSGMIRSNQGPETCNTYNMLRLTKQLHLSNPKTEYLDYYERALYNHILSSEHPEEGGFVYFTPMRPQHYRVYSQPQLGFWCCVGSGLENHGKYGEMIYAHDAEDIYLNLFIASELCWSEKGVCLIQETGFPYEESTKITVNPEEAKKFGLHIRKPGWVPNDGFSISVNGEPVKVSQNERAYVAINREWQKGDVVEVSLPMQNKVEYLPDGSPWVSFLRGPIVLAAVTDTSNLGGLWADDSRMGHVASDRMYPLDEAPFLVSESQDDLSELMIENAPMDYSVSAQLYNDQSEVFRLVPFYTVHEARYMIYWQVYSEEELERKMEELKNEESAMLALEEITVDMVATGEQQPETEHGYKGENTEAGMHEGKYYRHASGWFSYELDNSSGEGKTVRVTYSGGDKGRTFDIIVNGELLETVNSKGHSESFFTVDYPLRENMLTETITIKFEAAEGSMAGGVFEIRLIKE